VHAPIPFPDDEVHASYDAQAVHRFWRALAQADRVLCLFRTGFLGKASPVQFFWGSFDLAVTRFSGRVAPPHPGGIPGLPDAVTREAYSHEVCSAGFWPGSDACPQAAFYAYAYPTPDGFAQAAVEPADAFWCAPMGEFLLPYEAVRTAADPNAALLGFLQSTYTAAATLAGWVLRIKVAANRVRVVANVAENAAYFDDVSTSPIASFGLLQPKLPINRQLFAGDSARSGMPTFA
jgi:hypothetical protein